MSWTDTAGHLSFVLMAVSLSLRNMLFLRLVSVMSGLVGIAYNYHVTGGPLWLVIVWLSVFMAINVVQIVLLCTKWRTGSLTVEEQSLAKILLPHFSSASVRSMMQMARWKTVPVGQSVIAQGTHPRQVLLLCEGEMAIRRDGIEVARVQPGTFLGEISFLVGEAANADVVSVDRCRCIAWSRDELEKRLASDPSLHLQLHQALAADLCAKVGGVRTPIRPERWNSHT